MTQPDFEQIRARTEAADEGPWYLSDLDTAREDHRPVIARLDLSVISRHEPSHQPTLSSPNAQFFLHAREDIPALLAAIDELTNDLAEADELNNDLEARNAKLEAVAKIGRYLERSESVGQPSIDTFIIALQIAKNNMRDFRAALDALDD